MEKLNENFVGLYKRWSGGRIREEDINNIKNILEELGIDEYTINKDGTVDVNGDVRIKERHLINGKLPIRFGKVTGSFNCSSCENLTSLEGTPYEIGGNFYCWGCKNLTSLDGAPKEVGGSFYCSNCSNLTSLKGAPKEVGGDFNCGNCINLPDNELKKLINKGVHVVY